MIIEQTYDLLFSRYRSQLEVLTISDVRIGKYLTAVRLSDDTFGTSATLGEELPFCLRSNRDFGDFTPLKIKGQKVRGILETKKNTGTLLSLRMAVLNAISSKIVTSGSYRILEDTDPAELLDLSSRRTVTVVGAFHSYIRKISETGNKLYVLEMNEEALAGEFKKFYVPAAEYKSVVPLSDIIIITGQTLVNRTIDDILEVVSPGTIVIVTGPSSNILPDVLFGNKVTIIGAMRITDPGAMFEIVSQGGSGYHLFEYCARKICILKGDGQQA